MLERFSVKKPYTVLVGIILVILLGVIAFTRMTMDLLPSMNFPYVIVYTSYVGATPEQVEDEITRPMEAAFATLTDVKNITSQSRDNVGLVILEFNDTADMNTAMIEINSEITTLQASWDDGVGAPAIMKINPDMLPVNIVSVSRDDMDILELSEYVRDELVPEYESINGVASATASGVVTQEVDIRIEQSRIDVLNYAILEEVDDKLAEVSDQLDAGQAAIEDGRGQLARQKSIILRQLNDAEEQLNGSSGMIDAALTELRTRRTELADQLSQLDSGIAQMETMLNIPEEDVALLQDIMQQLGELEGRREELLAEIKSLNAGQGSETVQAARDEAAARLNELQAEKDSLEKYLEDLRGADRDQLTQRIEELEGLIEEEQQKKQSAATELTKAKDELQDTQIQIDELERQISEYSTSAPTAGATPADQDEQQDEPGADPTESGGAAETKVPTSVSEAPAATDKGNTSEETPAATEDDLPPETTEAAGEELPELEPEATIASPSDNTEEQRPEQSTAAATDAPKEEHQGAPAHSDDPPAETADVQAAAWGRAAYADEVSLETLQARLRERQSELSAKEQAVTDAQAALDAHDSEINKLTEELGEKELLLEQLDDSDTSSRIASTENRINALSTRIGLLETEIEELDKMLSGDSEALAQAESLLTDLDEQIASLKETDAYKAMELLSDRDALNEQYAAALEGRAQLQAGIAQIDSTIEKLENGIVPGGFIEGIDEDMDLASARSQLRSGRRQALAAFSEAEDQLDEAARQLAEARKEFEDGRDEALKNAGLDGIITVETVAGLIGAQNISMPAGYVYDLEEDAYLVRVGDRFSSLQELRHMKLFSVGGEKVDDVRLEDVASVEIADDSADTFTKVDGLDGILLSIEKQSTFSTTDVSDRVALKNAELMNKVEGLHIVDMFDQGDYINIIVRSVLENLLYGAILAILVLLIFLLDWRPTLIVALSIPLSVVITFVCMYFSGITLNVLSLSGLALGIGMLVDNSIVAIENIFRLRNEEGMPLLHACVEGVRQVSGSLFASTLTTVCVFVPVLFVTGLAHDLFTDLGLTIAFSLLASLLVAMTVVPSMAASLLKRDRRTRENGLFVHIRSGYTRLLRGALRIKPLVLLAAVGLLVFSVMQVPKMGVSFMPEVNSTQMTASMALDSEKDLSLQQETALDIMERMMEIPGIETVGLTSGSSLSALSGGGSSLTYYIIVQEDPGRSNQDIARDIRNIGASVGTELSVETSTMDISMLTGSGISVNIAGNDLDELQRIAADVAEIARNTEGTAEIDDGLESAVPEMRITVDKEKARENNLTAGQILQFVATKLSGKVRITSAELDGKDLDIYLIDERNGDITPETLKDLSMEVTSGDRSDMVRIGDVASVTEAMSFSTIRRADQKRVHTVSFAIAEGYSANHVSDAFEEALASYEVSEGYSVSLAGENETVMGIMDDMVFMVIIAIVMIFLIMVAQFQSFRSPIIVMFTIPLAFTGGLLALQLTSLDLSIVAMIGFLVLSGVIVNNGIVFVDTVNQLRIAGMAKKEALVETGRLRMRPIMMTSATTILGMLMVALGSGMGAEMMQPMAIVTIGGLAYATLMTLFIVPCLYDLFNGEKMKARVLALAEEDAALASGGSEEPVKPAASAPENTVSEEEAPAAQESAEEARLEEPDATIAAPPCEEPPQGDAAIPAVAETPIVREASAENKERVIRSAPASSSGNEPASQKTASTIPERSNAQKKTRRPSNFTRRAEKRRRLNRKLDDR